MNVIMAILCTVFGILLVRLFFLQVLSPEYSMLAMGNAVYRKVIYPDRGIMFDRKGRPILENTTTRDLMVLPSKLKKSDIPDICRILGIDTIEYRQRLINAIVKNGRYRPSVFEPTLSVDKSVKLQENAYLFEPGFYLQERPIRTYPYHAAAQILGYIGEVDSNILRRTNYFYQMGDYLGLNGIERYYERVLMGERGVSYQLRDNKNRIMGAYEGGQYDTAARAGKNLRSYLDIDIQQLAERFFANKLGAVVAIEPSTGGIIAMASGPTYDPNQLTGGDRRRNFSYLLSDTARPLFNRAIKGQYPPGSTIKPMGALIALDEGVISPDFGYGCTGAYHSCGRPIRCTHAGGGHASDLRTAMANSCNAYFSHIFRLSVDKPAYKNVQVGYDRWKQYANAFGMGTRLGVDLPSEDKGMIVDTSFYNRLYRGVWNSCNNVFLGIGQGELTATPLQMANLMCIIANKGHYYTPHFVSSIDSGGAADTMLAPFRIRHEVTHISPKAYEAVQLGMQDVVERGTARVARLQGISVAAKTGTAENYGIIHGKRVKLDDHSWFVAFAPREAPRIAIAVIVENAGFGATWAGPIASLLIEKYLTDSLRSERLAEVERIAAKEILLPVIKQKRKRMDSLWRARLLGKGLYADAAPPAPRPRTLNLQSPGRPVRLRADTPLPPARSLPAGRGHLATPLLPLSSKRVP